MQSQLRQVSGGDAPSNVPDPKGQFRWEPHRRPLKSSLKQTEPTFRPQNRPATARALERLRDSAEASQAYDKSKHWRFIIMKRGEDGKFRFSTATKVHHTSFKVLFDAYIQPHLDSIKDGRNAIEDGRVSWYIVEPNCGRALYKCKVKPVEKEARGAKGHKCMVTILEHAGRDVLEYYNADPSTRGRIRFKDVSSKDTATIDYQVKHQISQDAPCKDAFKLWLKSREDASLYASDYAKIDDLAKEFKEWVDNNRDYVFKGDPKSKEYTARHDSKLFSRGVLPEYSHIRRHLETRLEDTIANSPGFGDQVDEWKAHYAQQESPATSETESTSDMSC